MMIACNCPPGAPPERTSAWATFRSWSDLVERYAKKAGKSIRNITKQTLDLFQAYEWAGNVRELQNVIESAVVLSDGDTFSIDESWLKGERWRSHPDGDCEATSRPRPPGRRGPSPR